jgi:hypothetical protein
MNYSDINRNMTLPMRQRSLFDIIAAAQMAAHQSKENIYVIFSPFYVDEHVDSQHVYATKAASAMLYKQREGIEWQIDAVVEPNGKVFFSRGEDALIVLTFFDKEKTRISIQVVEAQ